jgi:hypothetical protein
MRVRISVMIYVKHTFYLYYSCNANRWLFYGATDFEIKIRK